MKYSIAFVGLLTALPLWGIPTYARRYNRSCIECHVGYPKLRYEAEKFKYNNYMPEKYNPRMKTVAIPKDMNLYLSMEIPVSFRFQTFLGYLFKEDTSGTGGKWEGYGEVGGSIQMSYNLSSISSFYAAFEYYRGNLDIPIREVFFSASLPAKSRLLVGKYDLSEFFVKRSTRLTYADLMVYGRSNLSGVGLSLSLTPYFQAGVLDFRGVRTFVRTGAKTKHFSFGIAAIPVDSAQRYTLDLRLRFAFLDLFTTTVFGFNQPLGRFQLKDSSAFIAGSYGLDLTFGRFFTSFLYNYVGNVDANYMPLDHLSLLSWAFGFYPVSNLRIFFESGFNFAQSFPGKGSYTGLVFDWAF